METFVLSIFQEQLSKFIVDFKKEQVNANLLNGKGEIHNVELNCDFLNETLSKVTPFVQLESVHVSKLSFNVTSWTNLRKAPIVVDVENVTARVAEPFGFLDKRKRRRIQQILGTELFQRIRSGLVSTRGPYNLFDRILDNLTIEIASVKVHFQPYGAFKTKRVGPWTPPAWQVTMAAIRWTSVDEYGCEGTPEQVWRHNHHASTSFFIYKKLEMEYQISIVLPATSANNNGPNSSARRTATTIPLVLGRDNKTMVQLVFERRLRDGAILAVQIDTTCPKVEIDVPAHAVAPLMHALTGLTYCLSKDRAFVDPLCTNNSNTQQEEEGEQQQLDESTIAHGGELLNTVIFDSSDSGVMDDDEEESVLLSAASNLPVPVEDMSSSSESEEEENQDTAQQSSSAAVQNNQELPQQQAATPATASAAVPASSFFPATSFSSSSQQQQQLDRPVILLPNGIVIHEKISISISVHHATVRGTYVPEDDGHIQLVTKGFTGEAMWPKVDQHKGGYGQLSVSYVSVQERHGSRIRTILVGGAQHDSGGAGVEGATESRPLVNRDETFPMYEDRSVRADPLGVRYTFPEQAFGLKTTIGFVRKLGLSSNNTNTNKMAAPDRNNPQHPPPSPPEEEIHVLHEVGIEHFDIVLDSQSWNRALRFALNEKNGGFDPRWHSGDWSDCLMANMLVNPSVPLNLEECIQPTKQIFLDQNDFPSSDLFNVTARVKNIEIRIPAAILDDVRSCDIMMNLNEAMLVVSSALPRTFLSGKIGNSVNGDDAKMKGVIDFPNDPSDLAYVLESSEDPSNRQRGIMTSRAISTFRLQLTIRGFDIRLVPIIPIGVAPDPQQLLTPTELTMIVCFEGEPPESEESNLTKIVFFTSILAHRFDVNVDFDLATSAIGTLAHHAKVVQSTFASCQKLLQASTPRNADAELSEHSDGGVVAEARIRRSLSGRRVLVRRQIHQSRETGGLSGAFCLQAAGIRFTLWRQNVPYNGLLRSPSPCQVDQFDSKNAHMPLLKLMCFDVKEPEVGVEAIFRRQHRRVVLKACLSEMDMKTCDLARLQQEPAVWARQSSQERDEGKQDQNCPPGTTTSSADEMIEIFALGKGSGIVSATDDSESSVEIRIEEQREKERSWSFAMDVPKGAVVCCQIEAIESLVLLIFEALLSPAWAKADTLPSGTGQESWAFPSGSVGALLLSLIRLPIPSADFSSLDIQLPMDTSSTQVPGGIADRVLRDLIDKVAPDDVHTILIRYRGGDTLVKVPKVGLSTQCFGLLVERSELLVSYLANDDTSTSGIMNVLGRTGDKWSSIILSKESGLRHSLHSRQRLVSCAINPVNRQTEETLVEPFECGYEYAKSKAYLSMTDAVVIKNVEKLDHFLACLQTFVVSSKGIFNNVSHIVSTVRRPELSCGSATAEEETEKNPIELACSSTAGTIRSARESLTAAKDEFALLHSKVKRMLRARDLEIMKMRRIVFKKEKERLSAAALVSSAVTGWLRIGSPQRTGQRGMMTSNLLPKWTKLRRSFLITYPGPSENTPTDVINVDGASLHQLTGGSRRRDLKRAFAIVERSGVVHLVVTTDDEYYKWVQELLRFADLSGPSCDAGEGEIDGLDVSQSSAYKEDEHFRSLSAQEDQNQKTALGRSLKIAVRVAKATSQAVVERRRRRLADSGTDEFDEGSVGSRSLDPGDDAGDINALDMVSSSHGRIGRGLTKAVQVAKATGQVAKSLAAERAQHSQSQPDTPAVQGGRPAIDNTSQQVRNRFAGVGLATKSRFGSALQAARQKGKDVASNTRMRMAQGDTDNLKSMTSSSRLNAIEEKPGEASSLESHPAEANWHCSSCTFINEHDSTECTMCGTRRTTAYHNTTPVVESMDTESSVATAPASSEHSKPFVASETDGLETVACLSKLNGQSESQKMMGEDFLLGPREELEDSLRSEGDDPLIRPGMKQRLGAAVRSVRLGKGTQEGQVQTDVEKGSRRFSLRRQLNSNDEPYGVPDAIKLRNVKLNGPLSLPPHPIHGNQRIVPEIPSKRLEGSWIVRVEPISIMKQVSLLASPGSTSESGLKNDEMVLEPNPEPDPEPSQQLAIELKDADPASLAHPLPAVAEPRPSAPWQAEGEHDSALNNEKMSSVEGLRMEPPEQPASEAKDIEPVSIKQLDLVPEETKSADEAEDGCDPKNYDPCEGEGQNAELSSEPPVLDSTNTSMAERIETTSTLDVDESRIASNAMEGNQIKNVTVAVETISLESAFRIKVLKQDLLKESSDFESVAEFAKSLSDILQLHTMISESITFASMTSLELPIADDARSRSGEAGKSLAASLGLTTVEAVRITGKILTGLLEVTPMPETEIFHKCCADAVGEFLNSMLDCSLPIDGLAMFVDFLGLSDASTLSFPFDIDHSVRGLEEADHDTDEYVGTTLDDVLNCSRDPFALSAVSDARLIRAENQALLAGRLACSSDVPSLSVANSLSSENELRHPVSHQFREAMYSALMTVMEERDEAHARLVAASVINVHETEQQRKALRRLSSEIEALKSLSDSEATNQQGKLRRAEKEMQQDSEAELMSLCRQLATEISARTAASLEIVRLKESRKVERENEAAERQTLEEELRRTKELVAMERSKLEQSRRESRKWMQSYEEAVHVGVLSENHS